MNDNYNRLVEAAEALTEYLVDRRIKPKPVVDLENLLKEICASKALEVKNRSTYNDISHLMHITGLSFDDSKELLQLMTNTQHDDF
jgi:hypothetical protein